MQFNKFLYFLLFLTISSASLLGQTINRTFNCGYEEAERSNLQNNFAYEQQTQAFEKKYIKYIESQAYLQANETIYTLPTVVHIIHAGAALGTTANPTDVTVERVVNEATDRFRHRQGGDLDFSNPFSGVDTNIEFCLASTDPAGNYSTGVIRHYEPSLSTGPYTQLYDFIAATKWDDTKYCNLYIMTNMTNASGVYLGGLDVTVYTSGGFWSGLIGHEIGHYLSLRHTFQGGCTNNNCLIDGDRVCDTPPKAEPGFTGESCKLSGNSCTSDVDDSSENNPYRASEMGDQPDILENYMDYTGSCWDAFTQGQKTRMRLMITEHRLPLNTHASTACAERTKPAHEIGISSFKVEKSDCDANAIIKDIVVNNFGSSPVTSFSIEIWMNSTLTKTINQTTTIGIDAQIILPLEEVVTLQDGENTIEIKSKQPNGNIDGYTNNDAAYRSAYFQATPNKAPYQEAFSSTTFPHGYTVSNDNDLGWGLLSSFEAEEPCYGSHFVGALAYASNSETARIQLPLLDLSNGMDASLSFKYGYVQRYDFIVDTLSVLITTNCSDSQVVWKEFGTSLSTGTPSDGINVFPGCEYDKDISIDLSAFVGEEQVSIAFVVAGRFYSWLTLDDISITSTVTSCEAVALTIPDAYSETISKIAQSTISATSSIASGANVTFIAGESITLKTNFHAQLGSIFNAKIMGCELAELAKEMPPVNQKIYPVQLDQPDLMIYPNPFTTHTTIAYQLPKEGAITIQIFDWTGRRIISIEDNNFKNKGYYEHNFQSENLISGTYFVSFRYADQFVVKKMVIAK